MMIILTHLQLIEAAGARLCAYHHTSVTKSSAPFCLCRFLPMPFIIHPTPPPGFLKIGEKLGLNKKIVGEKKMSRRRVESNGAFDENDRSLYRIFRNTANLVSQFYSQSINSQKLAFEAGETYAILEMQEWMLAKMREGRMVTVADILGYVQAKIDSLEPANGMPGQAAAGHAGMAAPLFTPQEKSSYPGCSFGPSDQNSADLAVRLFAPEEWSPAPQEQDTYPDMQTDKM